MPRIGPSTKLAETQLPNPLDPRHCDQSLININQTPTKYREGLTLEVEATTYGYPVYLQIYRRRGERMKARESRPGGQIKK